MKKFFVFFLAIVLCTVAVGCSNEKEYDALKIDRDEYSLAVGHPWNACITVKFKGGDSANSCVVISDTASLGIGQESESGSLPTDELSGEITVASGDSFYWTLKADDEHISEKTAYISAIYLNDGKYAGYAVIKISSDNENGNLTSGKAEIIKSVISGENDRSYYENLIAKTIEKDKNA